MKRITLKSTPWRKAIAILAMITYSIINTAGIFDRDRERTLTVFDGENFFDGTEWTSADPDHDGVAEFSLTTEEAHSGDTSIKFHGEGSMWVGFGWNWHGYYPKHIGTDISRYKTLSFYIKVTGRKRPTFAQMSVSLTSAGTPEGKSPQVQIKAYSSPKILDGEWHEVSIPIHEFIDPSMDTPLDLNNVWIFSLGSWNATFSEFDIYVDDIHFSTKEVEPPPLSEKYSQTDVHSVAEANGFELPDIEASHNLVQNPSFEQGFLGYTPQGTGINTVNTLDYDKEWLILDDSTAAHGNYSARLQVRKDQFAPVILPYTMQLKPMRRYTISFWAKTDDPGLKFTTLLMARDQVNTIRRFVLSDKWERYAVTVTAKDSLAMLYMGKTWLDQKHDKKAHIWFDGVQLEEATEASDFDLKPVGSSIYPHKDLFYMEESKNLAVDVVKQKEDVSVKSVKVTVTDAFSQKLFEKSFDKLRFENDRATLKFSIPEKMDTIGSYVIRSEVKYAGGSTYDHLPVTVIKKVGITNIQHAKLLGFGIQPRASFEEVGTLMNDMGIGSLQVHSKMDESVYKHVGAPNNIEAVFPVTKAPGLEDLRKLPEFTDERKALLAQQMDAYFKKNHYIKHWKYLNEPDAPEWQESIIFQDPNEHVEFMKIVYEALKNNIPDAFIHSSDPFTAGPGGRSVVEGVLKAGGAKYMDALALHPYRKKPEAPDLSIDSEAFIALADKYDFDGPLYYTEGGFYMPYHIPDLGIRGNFFTGDWGRGWFSLMTDDQPEYQMPLALNLRQVFIVMKYSDRITTFINWGFNDLAFNTLHARPHPTAIGYNGIAAVLGNAEFKKEYFFGESARVLVFDNGEGKAVGVFWDSDAKLETLKRGAYKLQVGADADLKLSDVFLREKDVFNEEKNAYHFSLDYLPQYIYADSVSEMLQAIENAELIYTGKEQFIVNSRFKDKEVMEIKVQNRSKERFEGQVRYKLGDKSGEKTLSIPKTEFFAFDVNYQDLMEGKEAGRYMELETEITDENNESILKEDYKLNLLTSTKRKNSVVIDGDLDDWKGIPAYEISRETDMVEFLDGISSGEKDLSAKFYSMWDEENLYLAVEVTDDVHVQDSTGQGSYIADGLQIAIDAYNNGSEAAINTEDDYTYHIYKNNKGDEVYRIHTPIQQLAFLDRGREYEVPVVIKRDGNKTIYEIQFPKKFVQPLDLKLGNIFGLAVCLNDADGQGREAALITATRGKEIWIQPQNLPDVLLIE